MTSGIYCIFCFGNGKFYIGSSQDVKKRLASHKRSLRINEHFNEYLQNAWSHYGEHMFVFCLVENCEIDNLVRCEQEWLDRTKCYEPSIGFNECRFADRTTGYKHTEEYVKSKSKDWILTSPIGEQILVNNLKKFCRENGLSQSGLWRVAVGRSESSKGWHCRPNSMSMLDWKTLREQVKEKVWEDNNVTKRWIITDPFGVEHDIVNLHNFCRKHDLNPAAMMQIASGRYSNHKNWKCRRPI